MQRFSYIFSIKKRAYFPVVKGREIITSSAPPIVLAVRFLVKNIPLLSLDYGIFVVAPAKQVHRTAKLMEIDERADNNERTEEIPLPKISCTKIIINFAEGECFFHALGYVIMPNGNND